MLSIRTTSAIAIITALMISPTTSWGQYADIACYYNDALSQAVVYAVTAGGDLEKYSTGEGFESIGNYGVSSVVSISTYYNPALSQAVVYAVTSEGQLEKYSTGEGFESIGDYGVTSVMDIACYYNDALSQAVVYAVTAGGDLEKYSTGEGFESIGNYGVSSVVSISAYYNPALSQAVVYAVTSEGQLEKYSTGEGFESIGWFPTPVGVTDHTPSQPRTVFLGDPHPNPFNPRVAIPVQLAAPATVHLRIYDLSGRLVRTLWNGSRSTGTHVFHWDGRNSAGQPVASGAYSALLNVDSESQSRGMILMK